MGETLDDRGRYGDREKGQDKENSNNNNNNHNNSQHIKHLLHTRQSSEHFYEFSYNPHSLLMKQKLLLSHFADEETESEGTGVLPRVIDRTW